MNEPNERGPSIDDRDSRLLDALLGRTLEAGANDDARLKRLMSSLRGESAAVHPPSTPLDSPRSKLRWISVPLVASAVAAILFVTLPGDPGQSAVAALNRGLQAEQGSTVREYAVVVTSRRLMGQPRSRNHQLFVRQNEFAVCTDPLIGKGEVWAGGGSSERWIVPRAGMVVVGDTGTLPRRKADRQVLETPFLSVERILERTKRFYELRFEPGVSFGSGDEAVVCDRIIGRRIRSPRFVIPLDVEILIDRRTGFAQRIHLRWDPSETSRWVEASAEFVGTRDVPDDFFRHTGHHDGSRGVIRTQARSSEPTPR